jgi:hypothetical protein
VSKILYIDYENVQNIDLSRIAELDFKIWLFTGVSQSRIPIELVKSTQAFGSNLKWVTIAGSGSNALDFHIAYYLGVHSALNPKDEYFILSKDKGFDPLVTHVVSSKIRCRRISSISEIAPTSRPSSRTRKTADADGSYAKVVGNLTKIEETKRPRNRRTLRQHVISLVGKSQSEQKVDQILEQLFVAKVVIEEGGRLKYKPLTA